MAAPGSHADGSYIVNTVIEHNVTILQLIPLQLRVILEEPKFIECTSLRRLYSGGEPLSADIQERILKELPWVTLHNLYGPTETTIDSLSWTCEKGKTVGSIPIGRPIDNVQVYIVDNYLQPVPIGVWGELLIGGECLARGYLNRPELTAEKFIPHPFRTEPGERLYKTGDLTRYLADGTIEFRGRIDEQIKIRGYRIEPGEIEAVLGQHPAIKEAVVISREFLPRDNRLVAYVVCKAMQAVASDEMRNFLKEKLPEYMVPSAFVVIDSMPLTQSGKLDRKALPEPDLERPDLKNEYIAPRTPAEKLLTDIWCEVLGIRQVGIYDNFFSLGGHSLLVTQVMSRLREALHVEVPLRRLFETPTIAGLSHTVDKALDKEKQQSAAQAVTGSREKKFPLSFAQQRLWFLNQLDPDSDAYNIFMPVHLRGYLHIDALEKSIEEILRRHEALRTVYATEDDEPVQIIKPATAFTLQKIDLTKLPESQRDIKVQKLVKEESSRLFDLTAGPVLRAALVMMKPDEHILLTTVHHIVFDAWSAGILYRELSKLYQDFSKGNQTSLPELPLQYGDYAVWQRQWLHGEKLEEQVRFWREYLRDITTLELPTDRPRPPVQTFHGSKYSFQLSGDLRKALQDLSNRENVTLFMTMLAAFQGMMLRYTGQNDIVIGTPIANRTRSETEGLIGFFLNTLVIRADTSGNPAFRKMLLRVRELLLNAYTHQDLPFEKLVEELQPERDLSRNPLFQVLFTLQNMTDAGLDLAGITASQIEVQTTRTRFDLEVHIAEDAGGLKGAFVYNTDLFEASTIERMAGHYEKFLEGIADCPDQKLWDLPLLTDAERHQLLVEWNDTRADYPEDLCIHELFAEQMESNPDSLAVIFKDQRLTYRELNRRANQLAHYLKKQGIGPEVLVGICVERSLEMIICVLGVLKAGGAYVPFDPAYPEERLGFMMEDSGTTLLLTQKSLFGMLPANKAQVVCVDQVWEEIEKEHAENPPVTTSPENLAYVLYTSGSTGRPKGVAMQHRPLCNLISWQIRNSNVSCGAKTVQFASLSFDVSFQEIFTTLCSGGALMVVPGELRRDPAALLHYLEEESIERLFLPFVAFQQLAEVADWHDRFPRHLREVIIAGEQLRITPSIIKMFERLQNCRLYNQYGPTESHVVTAFQLSGAPDEWPSLPPIGRPISNAEIYLLDAEHNPVPVGIAGELYIGGECLAREYIHQPEMTSEKFIPNPFCQEPGRRLYKTGDRARYMPDGNIEYLGRLDHQVKVRGFRIEPGEIEAVLATHDSVREAVVAARPDTAGNNRLIAYVVLTRKSDGVNKRLRSYLTKRLPDFMIPSAFVMLDSLPLTPSGKVDRKALPEPELERADSGKQFVPPRNAIENQLTKIWENLLKVQPVGITDNFFELGGHSLLTVRLIADIKKATSKDLNVISVFKSPTIEQMARTILDEGVSQSSSSLIPIQTHGSKVPLFWVSSSYFMRYLEPDQPAYVLISWEEHGFLPVFSSIEDIASDCIERLLAERPAGPYVLGGYCFFGVVALEIARQLKRRGHEVPLLFLLDTSFNYSRKADRKLDYTEKANTFKSRIISHAEHLNGLENTGKIAYIYKKIPSVLTWVKSKTIDSAIRGIKVAVCRAYLFFGRPVPRPLVRFYVYNLYAMKLIHKYSYQGYSGRVVLINSEVANRDIHSAWLDLVEGEVSVHVIPKTRHLDMISEKYSAVWTRWLNTYLKEVEGNRSGNAL